MTDYLEQEGAQVWVPVPVEFRGRPWASAEEWAEWFAEAASRGREGAEQLREAVLEQCLLIAGHSAKGLAARYWHYPVDGAPSGFVDVRLAPGPPDERDAAQLLPDPGETALMPVVTGFEAAVFSSAARRLTMRAVVPEGADRPGTLATAEWIGVTADTVCYATSFDADVESLSARLDDAGRLFEAFGAALAAEGI